MNFIRSNLSVITKSAIVINVILCMFLCFILSGAESHKIQLFLSALLLFSNLLIWFLISLEKSNRRTSEVLGQDSTLETHNKEILQDLDEELNRTKAQRDIEKN